MKYIRTKDENNLIIDMTDMQLPYNLTDKYIDFNRFGRFDIVRQADTIEELIMPGDLVRYDGLYMSWIEKDRGEQVRGIDMHLIPRKSVDMLWIPTGNDAECYPDFKLVASKEDDKGELELL